MTWQSFFKSRWATAVLAIVLVLVMIVTAQILVQKNVVDKEIAKLQNQMEAVKKDNDQLSSLMQYLNTPQYEEKQAREQLNLSKPGEIVVALPQQQDVASASIHENTPSAPSNYKLWFNYFFNHAD